MAESQTLFYMRALLRIFFYFLYHQFAFAYDLVADTVSFGHWKNWTKEAIPFIKGTRTLELGHGPGHLQRILLSRGLDCVAIDESTSMGRLAQRNTDKQARLTRGLVQHLPFAARSFDTVIATFPAEYIADPRTLSEVKRCLSDTGRFVVLPVAMPKNRILSWLFKITGQAPSDVRQVIQEKLEEPFIKSDFDVQSHVIDIPSGTLIVVVAEK
ncbi:MAG TPA: class I SAM-dependent methyltransferase [Anaerolineales bacterium]|nr:class I SAM-dependent methyltransferase [Anaerolineales bacterium]